MQEVYEIQDMLAELAQTHIRHRTNRPVDYKLQIDETLPAILMGDCARIKQIISILLSNAFRYTEKGSVTLSFGFIENRAENDYITLVASVRDTGIGMTEEQVNRVYEDFANTCAGKNSDASLVSVSTSITNRILSLLNAKLDILSELNVGTTIIVSIPQIVASAKTLGAETARYLSELSELSGEI